MATVQSVIYRVASGSSVNAGLFSGGRFAGWVVMDDAALSGALVGTAPPSVPAWRGGMAANTWKAIGTSTIGAIDPANDPTINPNYPSPAPWKAVSGQIAVLGAWGSAAWDEDNKQLWIPIGGGHDNYAGNECYRQPLGDSAPTWVMPRKPSGAIGNTVSLLDGAGGHPNTYPDDRPRSAHVYNNVCYVPGVGPVLVRLAAVYQSGQSNSQWVFALDPATGETRVVADLTSIAPAGGGTALVGPVGNPINAACCYDPTRNRVYTVGTQGAHKVAWLTPSATPGTWTGGNLTTSIYLSDGRQGIVYIPTIDRILHIRTASGAIYHALIHPDTGASTDLGVVSGTPPSGFDFSTQMGADWNSDQGWLGMWNQSTSTTTVCKLTPSGTPLTTPWILTTLTLGGSNAVTPGATEGNGIFGRWRYSPSLRGFILLLNNTQPTLFYATEVI